MRVWGEVEAPGERAYHLRERRVLLLDAPGAYAVGRPLVDVNLEDCG